jgi:hypothetical protein
MKLKIGTLLPHLQVAAFFGTVNVWQMRGCSSEEKAVFRIRRFLGLPDPLIRDMDPDPSIIKQK